MKRPKATYWHTQSLRNFSQKTVDNIFVKLNMKETKVKYLLFTTVLNGSGNGGSENLDPDPQVL